MYQGIVNAEKQKGASMREAMGAFGQAIDPKTIAMKKFKQEFTGADMSNPDTLFKMSQRLGELGQFEAALGMQQKGMELKKFMAPAPKKVTGTFNAYSETEDREFRAGMVDGSLVEITAQGVLPAPSDTIARPAKGASVTVQVGDGTQAPTKGQLTKIQGRILDSEEALRQLDDIGEDINDEYLTYWGKLQAYAGSILDQAGVSKESAIGGGLVEHGARARAFKNKVQQRFNAYRKEITGAAAALAELDRLEQSFLTDKNMGPETFKLVLGEMQRIGQEGLEELRRAAREGINVKNPSTPIDLNTASDDEINAAFQAQDWK
jgi:hypothetical protein